MARPQTFAPPPATTNPQTGELQLSGAAALPWAIDTLAVGGEIRSRLIRLQNWVQTYLELDKRK